MPGEPGRISQQRREPLHPPVNGDVIDLDAALGQQLLHVAEGQAERRYHRTASTITSAGNRNRAKADRGGCVGRGREDNVTGQSCPNPLTID
jgi:hypothetical protein